MRVLRPPTLVWPGLPWLWLRGSVAGLVLALAFAVALDMAIIATWIWTEFLELPIVIGLWAGVAAVWVIATVSAATTFPAPLQTGPDAAADALFTAARDAYLARDWLAAETKLRSLLVVRPTDGEAQLLLGTLLRRVGRLKEARSALEALSRSDAGTAWRSAIVRELDRVEEAGAAEADTAAESAAVLSLASGIPTAAPAERAA
jgi:signal transduction histidine kinase